MTATRSEPLLQITLLGEAVEHAPVGVFVFDDRGEYVAVNRFGCELLGYQREAVLGSQQRRGPADGDLHPLGGHELREAVLGSRIGAFAADPPEALRSYRAVVDAGFPEGVTHVRRADGTVAALRFRARETAIGGMTFYIGIAWAADAGAAD